MPTNFDVGGFTTNLRHVVRQLKHDLKDDWYPDSLGYEDSLEPEVISEAIAESLESNDGIYIPGTRTLLNIPKKGFVLRYSLETSLLDRAYYHALVSEIVPYYDKLLSRHVLSHRYASSGERGQRYLFRHPIDQWKLFKAYVVQESDNKYPVVVTDIQNYFENIRIDKLIQLLLDHIPMLTATGPEKARIRVIIEHLDRCPTEWCFRGNRGLPQNRDASSFLGNIFMIIVDEAMLNKGYKYFRYMDDIKIVASSKYNARAALQDLIVELRKIGLNVKVGMDGTGAAVSLFGESLPLTAGAKNINNAFKNFAIIQRLSAATFFPDISFVRVPGRLR